MGKGSEAYVALPSCHPELAQRLQLLIHEHGVAHAQLQRAAGSAEATRQVPEDPADVCLGDCREVGLEASKDLCQGGAVGPQRQEGRGNGDIQRGEGDIAAGVLGSQQLVEAEGKVAALEADLRLSTGVLLHCSPDNVLLVKHVAPEAVDSGAEPSHQESQNQER